jgi:hypothetical protein
MQKWVMDRFGTGTRENIVIDEGLIGVTTIELSSKKDLNRPLRLTRTQPSGDILGTRKRQET